MTLDWPALLGAADRWVLVANLPYNVATPLVADLLDGVPAIARMLVMVQREVGERLVAAPRCGGVRRPVSVKVAYWATAHGRRARAGVGLHAQAERRVGARRDRAPASRRRRARGAVRARAHGVRPAPQDAATVARRRRRRPDVRRRRHRRDGAPEELGLDDWVRLTRRGAPRHDRRARPGQADPDAADHRRPRRRLPPARRRDGVPRPRRRGHDRPAGTGVTVGGPYARRRARRRFEPRRPGLAARAAGPAACTSTSASPTAVGSAAARPTPRRCLRWAGYEDLGAASRLGADVPFCIVGGRARVAGSARSSSRLARADRRHARRAAAAREHAGRLPGVGRPRRTDGATARTTSSRPPSSSSRRWRRWRDRIAELPRESRRCSPAAARRGSCPASATTPSRPCGARALRWWWPGRRRADTCLLATLVAGAPEHLLVLLLAHPLAALLDQRTHRRAPSETRAPTAGQATGRCAGPARYGETRPFRGRSIGRTPDFGSVNRGSIPLPGAMNCVTRPPT